MAKIILANRFDGLGERLIALLNAIYLSNICNVDFKFIWNSMDETNPDIAGDNVIFPSVPDKEDFFNIGFINKYYINYKEQYYNQELWNYKNQNIKGILIKMFDNADVIQCNLAVPIASYFKDIELNEYRKKISKIWIDIDFSQNINTAMQYANIISTQLENYNTIHIRGGDIVYRNDLLYLLTPVALPLHLAIEIILLHKEEKIIIMGNDVKMNRWLKMKFNQNNNIFISEDFLNDKEFDATQKAIFDVILMSKSKQLYFTGASGFSNLSYLIGSCEPIYIYDYYSTREKYYIIKKNMDKYYFDNYHHSFSCMYLYIYGDKLKLPYCKQIENIKLAIKLREDAFIYKVLLVDILLQEEKYQDADNTIRQFGETIDYFLKDLLYEVYGVAGDFLYIFAIKRYFKIKNIKEYPILAGIVYFMIYNFIKINSKLFTNDMNNFLQKNLVDFEVIEQCDFLKNKHDILTTLSMYFVKNYQSTLSKKLLKTRIHNQLSYKLGQTMIINSKSIFGILCMPIYIISTIITYNQEQKIYKAKIKKDPSLKLPPLEEYPDYKEALKEKECLTYKLGQALIQANKTWYKGGYIKLWFEVRKLKREFKKDNK
ncbi:hypothetical protein O8I57_05015 [Campylobacter lari]|uniref:hypothetical protein n=1 Tax=Campylobacter lari TaxID=201 RepID=UPI0037266CCB